jgi:hypothetical protein
MKHPTAADQNAIGVKKRRRDRLRLGIEQKTRTVIVNECNDAIGEN